MMNRKFPSHKPSWLDDKLDEMEQMYKKQMAEPHLMRKREFVQRMTKDLEKKRSHEDEKGDMDL